MACASMAQRRFACRSSRLMRGNPCRTLWCCCAPRPSTTRLCWRVCLPRRCWFRSRTATTRNWMRWITRVRRSRRSCRRARPIDLRRASRARAPCTSAREARPTPCSANAWRHWPRRSVPRACSRCIWWMMCGRTRPPSSCTTRPSRHWLPAPAWTTPHCSPIRWPTGCSSRCCSRTTPSFVMLACRWRASAPSTRTWWPASCARRCCRS